MPLIASLSTGRLTQGFFGAFSWEPYGLVRTDTDVPRGARWLFNRHARYYSHVHLATDIAVPIGTPVRAMKAGTIVAQGMDSSGAFLVWLRIWRGREWDVYQLAYHLQRGTFRHPLGSKVRKGQRLANSGATGFVTGAHLHEEIVRARRGARIAEVYRNGVRFPIAPVRRGAIRLRDIAPR